MVGWKSQKIKIDEAEQHIRQGIRIVNELGMKPFEMVGYLYLGELFIYANEREKALEILERAEKAFQEMGMDYWLTRTQKILSKVGAGSHAKEIAFLQRSSPISILPKAIKLDPH